MSTKRNVLYGIAGISFCCFIGGIIAAILEGNSPYGMARKIHTVEAYEQFIAENPADSRVAEAKRVIGRLKFAFQPKFFLIFEQKDMSGEINLLNYSITNDSEQAATLVYVNAEEYDGSPGCRITVRLVDKKTKRERTILATSTDPEWQRVAVGSGQVTSIGGGSHTIDGHGQPEAIGQGLLLQEVLEYAQKLESGKP